MKFSEHLTRAKERAKTEDMQVIFVQGGEYCVINKDRSNRYKVEVKDKKIHCCECPQFARASICKHMIKVAMSSRLPIRLHG